MVMLLYVRSAVVFLPREERMVNSKEYVYEDAVYCNRFYPSYSERSSRDHEHRAFCCRISRERGKKEGEFMLEVNSRAFGKIRYFGRNNIVVVEMIYFLRLLGGGGIS